MSYNYTANTWKDGDIITAEKMNALEEAIEDASIYNEGSFPLFTAGFSAYDQLYFNVPYRRGGQNTVYNDYSNSDVWKRNKRHVAVRG